MGRRDFMKYYYKKSAVFLQFLILALIYIIMIFFSYYILNVNERVLKRFIFGGAGIFVAMMSMYFGEFTNRYVEFLETSIHFNSFRFKDIKMRHAINFNVKYEDVFSIETRKIPLIGVWAIYINAKNLPHKITISFCFRNYAELFDNLQKKVKLYNPNAYIDELLLDYCRRKNEK